MGLGGMDRRGNEELQTYPELLLAIVVMKVRQY
jgi:hypothetical protein